jgi:LacI family transcriptional regulator, galactose operon repressor
MSERGPRGRDRNAETPSAPMRPKRSPITIHDVARAASVSIGTVSKALNRNGALKQETRDRVIAVAQKLSFRPNDLAQSLHRGQTFTVGLITSDSFGRFSIPIMEGLEEQLSDARISVFMCNGADDPAREAMHVEALLGKRVDGIVVTGRRADPRRSIDVRGAHIPVLYAYSQSDEPGTFGLVPDDEGGARLAVDHLVALGRTRIAHITGPERFEAVRLRRRGYRKALRRAGLFVSDGAELLGEWSEDWGRRAAEKLFRSRRKAPDGIFCGNDQIARGVADWLRENGITVPKEVSIVGFDNWEIMAAATRPPLTTIDMNLRELGREAGRRMIELIDGKELRGVRRLRCRLVVRESCGAATD